MRWTPFVRSLPVAAIALLVGYGYLLEVRAPFWPIWPIEWRPVAELGFLVTAVVALVSAGLAGHLDRR